MSATGRDRLLSLAIGLALIVPVAWGQSTRPINSFVQQAIAVAAWCAVLMLLPRAAYGPGQAAQRNPALWAAAAGLGLCLLAALPAAPHGFLPEILVMLLGLLLMLSAARQGRPEALFAPLAWGLWAGGLLSVLIVGHQHLWPCQGDGHWIALNRAGRAFGNLRQPNLMGTYLVMALSAGAWLAQDGRIGSGRAGRALALLGAGALMLALAMTASRTAALALLLLSAWGVLDRRLGRGLRGLLIAAPLAYALAFALAAALPRAAPPASCLGPGGGAASGVASAAPAGPGETRAALAAAPEALPATTPLDEPEAPVFAGSQRLSLGGDLSSGRGLIYRDVLTLIQRHPWTGVGWGQLPGAWMLSEGMVWRRGLLSHAHNLPLQLAVEAGLPLALLVCALLAWALWRGRAGAAAQPAAAVMLLALGWHSLLEYPLWYAYFLLPACWLAGLMLGASPQGLARADAASATAAPQASGAAATARPGLRAGLGALALAATALAGWEFWALRPLPRIPDPQAKLAAARTAALRPFYGHYAAYLVILHPNARPEPRHFRTALRQAYSVKMLWNYAQSLHRAGRTEEARYVLLRLREFIGPSHPQVAPLFKACEAPAAAEPLPPCRLVKPAGITRWTQVLP